MTIDEILSQLDIIQNQLDTLRDNLIDSINTNQRLDEARRLTAHWALRGFPDINVVDIPLSTIQPSEVAGFMRPLASPVVDTDINNWLDFNNHEGKSDTIVMDADGPHSRDCNCVGCRQDGYVILVDFGMSSPPRYVCPHNLLHADKANATVFTYREAEDYIENTVTCDSDRSLYNIVLS